MIGIKIKNEWLDLRPDTQMSFSLTNPLYTGGNADVIQGSYSFPINIPLSPANRRTLNHPDRITSTAPLLKKEACEVWFQGSLLFQGEATISTANNSSASLYVVVNNLSPLKQVKMNELDLGTVTLGTDQDDIRAKMYATAFAPFDKDFLFFPVWNPGFGWFVSEDGTYNYDDHYYQNAWNPEVQNNIIGRFEELGPKTPFFKLRFILERMIESLGFSANVEFLDDRELELISLYSNKDIRDVNGDMPLELDIASCMNAETASSFLKNALRLFNAAPVVNIFENTVDFLSLRNILKRSTKRDWTKFASVNYGIEQTTNFPGSFTFKNTRAGIIQDITDLPIITIPSMDGLVGTPGVKVYYVEDQDRHIYVDGELGATISPLLFDNEVVEDVDRDPYESAISFLPTFRVLLQNQGNKAFDTHAIFQEGTFSDSERIQEAKFENRLLWYRGMHQNENGFFGLSSSAEIKTTIGDPVQVGFNAVSSNVNGVPPELAATPAKHSGNWPGDSGVYQNSWAGISDLLNNNKRVTRELKLPLSELIQFSFADKVRVENMDYLVRSLSVILTNNGLKTVKADMLAVT